jgi:predicted kinase
MAMAHLIHGFLGAGKTTYARKLETSLPAIRFTQDEWMVRLYGQNPPAAEFPGYSAKVSSLIDAVWPRCLEVGADVVLDLNFWSRPHRDEARRLASEAGARCIVYSLLVSDAVALERIGGRNAEAGQLLISPATFELLKARFMPLEADEPAVDVG